MFFIIDKKVITLKSYYQIYRWNNWDFNFQIDEMRNCYSIESMEHMFIGQVMNILTSSNWRRTEDWILETLIQRSKLLAVKIAFDY